MNTILLQPTDVLFFRDGRPMGGASAGHGAAWPLPSVINHAFHSALHRAGDVFNAAHRHRRGRSGIYPTAQEHRDRRFGSLVTAGPFPVCTSGADHTWFFPRPADADDRGSVFLHPHRVDAPSSLPAPCKYPVISTKPPSKDTPKPWWSEGAWNAYLGSPQRNELSARSFLKRDADFADTENQIGIGIDAETQTQDKTNFYSAHYLRLRDEFRLGLFAEAMDKVNNGANPNRDLIHDLLNGHPEQIVVGGQQRICTASRWDATGPLPLPRGLHATADFKPCGNGRFAVKWILLSPAIWPEIQGGISKSGEVIHAHPGGWLPNWLFLDWDAENRAGRPSDRNGHVLLKLRSGKLRRDYSGPRVRRVAEGGESAIGARLVAAIVPKPMAVTGWALANDTDRPEGGAKSTHLAVPAGAVYYFEANSQEDAVKLAAALNWHGSDSTFAAIKNRRSTLMGEKGFGLGVCGTWQFYGEGAAT